MVMQRSDGSELTSIELPAHHHHMEEVTNKAGIGVMKGRNEPEKAETGEELIDIPVVHVSTSSLSSPNTSQPHSGRLFKNNIIFNHFTNLLSSGDRRGLTNLESTLVLFSDVK